MRSKILSLVMLSVAAVVIFKYFEERKVENFEVDFVKLESFTSLPDKIKNNILSGKESEYSAKEFFPKATISEHAKLGKNLYSLAMSSGYYSVEKIKILKIAKSHLVYAKELERMESSKN